MASKSELERREIIESGSALASHSLNQRKIKHHLEGERRAFPISHHEARREKLRQQDAVRLRKKDMNILEDILHTLYCCESSDPEVFESQIEYLKTRKIRVRVAHVRIVK